MATCEKREIKQEPPPVEYVLTLSEHEMAVLRKVLWERPTLATYDTTAGAIYRALVAAAK